MKFLPSGSRRGVILQISLNDNRCLCSRINTYSEQSQKQKILWFMSYRRHSFRRSSVSNEVCQTCHGSYEGLANKTRSDKKANPHESHQGKLECSRCHKGHETARSYCAECHANFNQVMPEIKNRSCILTTSHA